MRKANSLSQAGQALASFWRARITSPISAWLSIFCRSGMSRVSAANCAFGRPTATMPPSE
jgi:hypothetical protein